ncbi:hypothetical protein ID866_9152 [Astraeus odoratus]|nr:hypothetical protein ID866_9152 [Astraeus odoratus]
MLNKTREEDVEEAEPHPKTQEWEFMMNKPEMVPHLQAFAQRAARYSINLDGQVHLTKQRPLLGSTAIIYQGILAQEGKGIMVAIKTPRYAPPNDEEVLKVILTSRSHNSAVYLSSLAHSAGGALMVKITP